MTEGCNSSGIVSARTLTFHNTFAYDSLKGLMLAPFSLFHSISSFERDFGAWQSVIVGQTSQNMAVYDWYSW